MEDPTKYLLRKIINHESNGLKSLGKLSAEHVDDISAVMASYAEDTVIDVIDRLNNGEEIEVNGVILSNHKVK